MHELEDGVWRVTLPLPTRPSHVHCYVLPGDDGWTLVDTGLGLPDAPERWATELAQLDGEITRILVTHFHPDHVGAAADVAALTGATVYQGSVDLQQCRLVWGGTDWSSVLVAWFHRHGAPAGVTRELVALGSSMSELVRYAVDAVAVDPGDAIDGWKLVGAAGHADGQLTLLRDGVLIAADHVLERITPAVGLWPASRPDPLADYLRSLERTIELAPRIAYPGHGEPFREPAHRARQIIAHHRERLHATEVALTQEPRTGFDVSFDLFGADLAPATRRFAVAETLSHLERLVNEGRASAREDVGIVSYTAG